VPHNESLIAEDKESDTDSLPCLGSFPPDDDSDCSDLSVDYDYEPAPKMVTREGAQFSDSEDDVDDESLGSFNSFAGQNDSVVLHRQNLNSEGGCIRKLR